MLTINDFAAPQQERRDFLRYPEISQREHAPSTRLITLAVVAPVFLGVIPAAIIGLAAFIDKLLRLPRVKVGTLNKILAVLLCVPGFGFAMWSIVAQFRRGKGTPVPAMASQELVVTPPYSYTRNPMALGTIMMYLSIGLWTGSISALAVVIGLGSALLAYIRRYEEPALEERFGEDYNRYRRTVPFLIPRLE